MWPVECIAHTFDMTTLAFLCCCQNKIILLAVWGIYFHADAPCDEGWFHCYSYPFYDELPRLECFPNSYLCDSFEHCEDGYDESNCTSGKNTFCIASHQSIRKCKDYGGFTIKRNCYTGTFHSAIEMHYTSCDFLWLEKCLHLLCAA